MKRSKMLNVKKIFIYVLALVAIIYGTLKFREYYVSTKYFNGTGNITSSSSNQGKYAVVKEDINKEYAGKRSRKGL